MILRSNYRNLTECARHLCSPVIDGLINPSCGDIYARIAADNQFGKENVQKAIEEYHRKEK